MRPGHTMVELLLALTLLSMVMLAVATWAQVTARASATMSHPVRWEAAARGVLDFVHDDLMTGDFEPFEKHSERGNTRVQVRDGSLRIFTRDRGEVIHDYEVDHARNELVLRVTDGQSLAEMRLLIGEVRRWQCDLDEESRVLSISITSSAGNSLQRSYLLHETAE